MSNRPNHNHNHNQNQPFRQHSPRFPSQQPIMIENSRMKVRSRSRNKSSYCFTTHMFCGLLSFLMGCLVCGIFFNITHQTSIQDVQAQFQAEFRTSQSLREEATNALRAEPWNPKSVEEANEKRTNVAIRSDTRNTFRNTHNAPLANQRILIALASFDFSQFPLLEEVLDAYHGLSIAGAHVDLFIHTSVPYTVALLDLLNTRFGNCDGGFCIQIVVVSPAIRLNLVDLHRKLFYDKIQEYDLFLYSEVSLTSIIDICSCGCGCGCGSNIQGGTETFFRMIF